MKNIKLQNTCLCAIVRDEEMNPAGGIEDFVNCTVPFVESAVIVDTGSKDKTRELLEDARAKYPHLQVYDKKFNGFANARNFSLRKGRKFGKYALVLDADERLFPRDFEQLERLDLSSSRGYNLFIQTIYEGGNVTDPHPNNPRLFLNDGFLQYQGMVYEIPVDIFLTPARERRDMAKLQDPTIKHFFPIHREAGRKIEEFYNSIKKRRFGLSVTSLQPSECPSFKFWKQLNPRRAEYQ